MFSKSANPDEIPLPMGSMMPNAALTPYSMPHQSSQFQHPTASILKKPNPPAKVHKYPPGILLDNIQIKFNLIPGPPPGLPPDLSQEEDNEKAKLRLELAKERSRKVRFSERESHADAPDDDDEDPDFEAVEIPESMLLHSSHEPILPPEQTAYLRNNQNSTVETFGSNQGYSQQYYYPPEAYVNRGPAPRSNPQFDEQMNPGAVISAAPQVI